MWFKNLSLYRFLQPFAWTAEELDARLAARAFRPTADLEAQFTGWVSPLGEDRPPGVHAAGGYLAFCARKEEKVMPAGAVRDAVAARVREIEQRERRPVRGRRRAEIKDDVIFEMLPRAFTRSRVSHAWVDPGGGWLAVDAASPRKAEEMVTFLRETLETLPVIPLAVASAPHAVMTGWLTSGEIPLDFHVEDECDLLDPGEDRGTVRARRQDLGSEEMRTHLDAGKVVTQLALTFEDRLSFVLDQRLTIKRLKFLDIVQEAAREVDAQSTAERFDADFAVMSLELARFLPRLVHAFGGEAPREG